MSDAPTGSFWNRAYEILWNYATDNTGTTLAVGKLWGAIVFAVGQFVVLYIVLSQGAKTTAGDWQILLVALAAWELAIIGAAISLVLGTSPADSANRWWQPKREETSTTVTVTETQTPPPT